ncbi:hypothetical protein [Verrucomicrobium sp. BvORR034]|jgi:hypothetical protein|uniref:hypothetical protein n=1 Tax=Verrucomicrobium sp. BvORR034 TaxID=1396418 RepID=UPI00224100E9|nr:hypothetical protein [Verrucomicrobium sp. BvORR034]
MKHRVKSLIVGALMLASTTALKADPREAEDVAYRMATSYVAKGFSMAPTDHSGVLGGGQAVRFLIPVTKGLDYVFLSGADRSALDVDVYVYDEVGNLILDDRRGSKLAGVQFRAAYNGTAMVYLHMARANGLASYYVLVGRRGVAKDSGPSAVTGEAGVQPN